MKPALDEVTINNIKANLKGKVTITSIYFLLIHLNNAY